MEAASRPPLEPLSDLPLEEPLESRAPHAEPVAAAQAAAPPAAAAPTLTSKTPEQTGLNFVDPEMFLATGKYPTIVPVEEPPAKASEPSPELELEDPVVDDLLTSPPSAPPAAKRAVAPAPAAPAGAKSIAGSAPREERSTRVPIAKTASLSAAATKLAAAASQRTVTKAVGARPAAPAAPKEAAADAAGKPPAMPLSLQEQPAKEDEPREAAPTADAAGKPPAMQLSLQQEPVKEGKPKEAAPLDGASKAAAPAGESAAPPKGALPPATAAKEAPSLASWTSARAAAAPAKQAAAVPKPNGAAAQKAAPAVAAAPGALKSAAPKPAPRPAAPKPAAPAPAAAAAAAPPAAALPSAPMDRDFIARNQVVERYLSGRLPLKGATDFERFCHEHPELLDDIGLPERVNAGLRLLEAAGKPEPWQEGARPAWQKPAVTLGLAAAALVFGLALAVVAGGSASKSHRIAELQKRATEQALDPATSTRSIRLMPSRSGASNAAAITIGGGKAELADLKIDESRSPYHVFRVTIDRIDQGRVGVITNLAKDSNGHLRIALNSSALGPGNYQLTLEGLDWRGDPQPDSWITIGVAR